MAEDKPLEKQKIIQRKYMEYQMAEQQIKQHQQQLEKLQGQCAEVEAVERSLDEMSKAKDGEEILVPVSGGIFLRAKVSGTDRFLVNVGAGVVVDKDVAGTVALIKEQTAELDKYKDQVTEQLAGLMMQHNELEEELKKLIED